MIVEYIFNISIGWDDHILEVACHARAPTHFLPKITILDCNISIFQEESIPESTPKTVSGGMFIFPIFPPKNIYIGVDSDLDSSQKVSNSMLQNLSSVKNFVGAFAFL